MLFTIDEKQITKVPHRKDFDAVLSMLGEIRAEEVAIQRVEAIRQRRLNVRAVTSAAS